jgi:DNA-binding transcriptional MerR regulator
MGVIRTNAAAAMLGVSPNTLRSWERRFGFPEPRRSAGGHRRFDVGQIEALRAAYEQTHDVSSAIALARDRGAGPAGPSRLRAALARLDEALADRVLEESLTVRSVERTVEEVLLPGVASLAAASLERAVAWRWATGWLAAARRVSPAPVRPDGVLLCDATAAADLDALHVQALELVLRRRGLRTVALGATLEPLHVTRALQSLRPRALVLCGRGASLDTLARVVFAARRQAPGGVAVLDFRDALPD